MPSRTIKHLRNSTRVARRVGAQRLNIVGRAVLCVIVLISGAPMQAQINTTATISGVVTDSGGAVIPNTAVLVTNERTDVTVRATTNASGAYDVPALEVGSYTVVFRKNGFESYIVNGIALHPTIVTTVDASLHPGEVATTVTVQATKLEVETTTPELSGEVSGRQAATLPLNGRNYQSLSALMPGVVNTTPDTGLTQGGFLTANVMSINGLGTSGTMYYVDGVWDMNSGSMGKNTITPNPDELQEVRVLQNNYSVEYNLNGASVVLLQTKSGTNRFHGDAFEYLRNTDLDARNYFSETVSPLQQNIFGFTVGGPAYIPQHYNESRQKTFFFYSMQWVRRLAGQAALDIVPTADEREGLFSESLTNPATGEPFPTNSAGMTQIGPLDPSSVAYMNAIIPTPNRVGSENYINNIPQVDNQLDEAFKVDENITNSTHLMGEYFHSGQYLLYPYDWSTLTFTSTRTLFNSPMNLGQVQLTHIFSPTMVNTTSLSVNDYLVLFTDKGVTQQSDIPGLDEVLPYSPLVEAGVIPEVEFSQGYSTAGVSADIPQIGSLDVEVTGADNWSWLLGHNYIQAGVQLLWGRKHQTTQTTNANGLWDFTGYATGNAMADFLLGRADTLFQLSNRPRYDLKYIIDSPYVEDNWHTTKRLTITAGLRYEYLPNLSSQSQFESVFVPSLYNPADAPTVNNNGTITPTASYRVDNGFEINNENGVPMNFTKARRNKFAPDAGFAWDVFGNGKTSVRGGYGISYYSDLPTNCGQSCAGNPPFVTSITLETPTFADSVGALTKPQGTPTVTSEDLRTLQAPMIQSYSLSVQHQFGGNLIASLAGAGDRADHLPLALNINQPSTDPPYSYNPDINSGAVFTYLDAPYRGYAAIDQGTYEGYTNWQALEASLRYTSHPLYLSLAYTWEHDLTDSSDALNSAGPVQNVNDPRAEYGNSGDDIPQVFTFSGIWSVPGFRESGWRNRILGGWKASDITTVQSGGALSAAMATSTKGLATRPDQVTASVKGPKTVAEWFNTSAFTAPAAGYFGTASPGSIRGPGLINFDVAGYKDFAVTRGTVVEFRSEFFNAFNHTNFSGVATGVGASDYGQVTSSRDPRIVEFALRFEY